MERGYSDLEEGGKAAKIFEEARSVLEPLVEELEKEACERTYAEFLELNEKYKKKLKWTNDGKRR